MDTLATGRRILGPLRSRYLWVIWGLIVQALGVGSVAVVVWRSVRNQSIGSYVTAQTIKFAWHAQLHTTRPYLTHPVTLFVAVPLAAVAGMLLLGVLALVIAALVNAADLPGVGGERRRRDR